MCFKLFENLYVYNSKLIIFDIRWGRLYQPYQIALTDGQKKKLPKFFAEKLVERLRVKLE